MEPALSACALTRRYGDVIAVDDLSCEAGAIVAVVAYAFLIDATLFAALPSISRFLPGKAGYALAGSSVDHLLMPAVGGAVLVALTSAFVVAASLRNDRTDI